MRAQRAGGVFTAPALAMAFDVAFDTVLATVARRDRLDAAITTMAAASSVTPVVTRLACLRGVATLTAFGLAVGIGDWHRLTGRSIGAYLGLVPTESSSGGSRSQGSITKTGNAHARRLLIEAAWHHRKPLRPTLALHRRQDAAGPLARDRANARTGACTPVGWVSMPGISSPWWPTPRSLASWPAVLVVGRARGLSSRTEHTGPSTSGNGFRW